MKKLALFNLLILLTISCQSQSDSKIKVISKNEFKQEISKDSIQLIDVRTPEEFKKGSINKAKNINVNDQNFETEIQKLNKQKPVYVYCRSGSRSEMAAKKMIELGFTEVIDLQGGYLNWN